MSLGDQYAELINDVEERMDRRIRREAVKVKTSMDRVLPFIGLLILFIVLFGFILEVNRQVELYVRYANYAVVAFFSLRLALEFKLRVEGQSFESFARSHWLDFAMVVPAFSVLDEVKLMQIMERSLFARAVPEATGLSFQGTSVAAKLTRISRMVKRSIGL